LAFRSGVSPNAIRRIEKGAELRRVTMQALAHTLEAKVWCSSPITHQCEPITAAAPHLTRKTETIFTCLSDRIPQRPRCSRRPNCGRKAVKIRMASGLPHDFVYRLHPLTLHLEPP